MGKPTRGDENGAATLVSLFDSAGVTGDLLKDGLRHKHVDLAAVASRR